LGRLHVLGGAPLCWSLLNSQREWTAFVARMALTQLAARRSATGGKKLESNTSSGGSLRGS
jgi:hypothetical protein